MAAGGEDKTRNGDDIFANLARTVAVKIRQAGQDWVIVNHHTKG